MAGDDACEGLRRRFARGFMDLIILRMLMREPLWGYKLMLTLRRDHDVRVGPPVVYPLLDSMEADGLVEGEDVFEGRRRRRVFRTTRRGIELVSCFEAILREALADPGSP